MIKPNRSRFISYFPKMTLARAQKAAEKPKCSSILALQRQVKPPVTNRKPNGHCRFLREQVFRIAVRFGPINAVIISPSIGELFEKVAMFSL
jgi:hypothetical protein